MKERTIVHWLVKKLHLKLSGVVGLVTSAWGGVHLFFIKPVVIPRLARSRLTSWACLPIEVFSMQALVAGFVVSIAASDLLAQRTTFLLGKRRDGSIDPVRYAMFLPYHIGLTTKLRLERSNVEDISETTGIDRARSESRRHDRSHEDPFNKITDGLYLGGWPADESLLPPPGKNGVAVCDVTCELPRRVMSIGAYTTVPVWDSHAPSPAAIESAVNWVVEKLDGGYAVLVHCAHGHGRSAVITGGVLRALGEASTVEDAVELMRKARPLVKMNARQLASLEDWEHQRYMSKRGKEKKNKVM